MIDFIHKHAKGPYLVAGIVVLWLVWTISGSVISRRYEKRPHEATTAANAEAQAAQVKLAEAMRLAIRPTL